MFEYKRPPHKIFTLDSKLCWGGPACPTLNDFSEGGDGGGPSMCDEKYHSISEQVVALLTGWYGHGSRCGEMIRITASNGKSVTAKVVDECDSEWV